MEIGKVGGLGTAGIGGDNPDSVRVLHFPPLDSFKGDRMAIGGICSDKEKAVGEVQAKYDQLVKNTAKSICCKAKVDNPQINFYDVVDNKITCLEQGANQLSC